MLILLLTTYLDSWTSFLSNELAGGCGGSFRGRQTSFSSNELAGGCGGSFRGQQLHQIPRQTASRCLLLPNFESYKAYKAYDANEANKANKAVFLGKVVAFALVIHL